MLVEDHYMVDWLSLAYGADEAEQAMHLPEEVLSQLYPHVTYYGPAGDEIAAFLTAVEDTKKQVTVKEWEWFKRALFNLGHLWDVENVVLKGKELRVWRINALPLTQSLVLDGVCNVVGRQEKSGMLAMVWLLTGQYLFVPANVKLNDSARGHVNEVLAFLQLPALHGALASRGRRK